MCVGQEWRKVPGQSPLKETVKPVYENKEWDCL